VLFGQASGDARADVYSLAATLWQLLVGRSPFEIPGGDNTAYALMPRIRTTPVPPTGRADVPTSLERLLAQAMSKLPASRPATALEFARALQQIEQEHRFPRTAIVVLDEQGHTTLADQNTPAGPDDGDATRVRSPQAVQAQNRAPAYAPPRMSGGAAIPAAVATTMSTNVGSGSASTRPAGNDLAEEGTVRVDRSRARAASGETTAAPAPPTATADPTVLLGAVGVLAAALVAVVVWVVSSGGDEPDSPPTGTKTVAGTEDRPILDTPQVPTLSAKAGTGRVIFSWTYANPEKGDTFRLATAGKASDLEPNDYVNARTATAAVKARKGQQVCAQVRVNRSGQLSDYSRAVCEKAG
jgi:hypothetical protein